MTNNDSPQAEKSSSGWLLIVLPSALAFYILSPIFLIAVYENIEGLPGVSDVLMIIYAPLEALYNSVPFVKSFYDFFFELVGNP
ncbi:MAG: hypothetical protein ACFCU3_06170 [Verrucomicrobiales bacterium]